MKLLRQLIEAITKGGEEVVFNRTTINDKHFRLTAFVKRDDKWFPNTPTQRVNGEELPVAGGLQISVTEKGKAIVADIVVNQEFRRQRVGEALYREAAKWMNENGVRLYASPTRSNAAKAVWAHLDMKGLVDHDDYGQYVKVL